MNDVTTCFHKYCQSKSGKVPDRGIKKCFSKELCEMLQTVKSNNVAIVTEALCQKVMYSLETKHA